MAHRLHGIGNGKNPGLPDDAIALQVIRITAAIQTAMMLVDDLGNGPLEVDALQHVIPGLHMPVQHFLFDTGQGKGLDQDFHRYGNLADIVNKRRQLKTFYRINGEVHFRRDGDRQVRHPNLVLVGVSVPRNDDLGERIHHLIHVPQIILLELNELAFSDFSAGDVTDIALDDPITIHALGIADELDADYFAGLGAQW